MKKPNAQQGELPKERFTIRLDPILASKIKALAKTQKCSIISIIEQALELYFKKNQEDIDNAD